MFSNKIEQSKVVRIREGNLCHILVVPFKKLRRVLHRSLKKHPIKQKDIPGESNWYIEMKVLNIVKKKIHVTRICTEC